MLFTSKSIEDFEKDVSFAEAEQELIAFAKEISADNKVFPDFERVVLISRWFPKLRHFVALILRAASLHPSNLVRNDAVDAVGFVGNRNDYRCLVSALNDPSDLVASSAADSMIVVGERLALPQLRKALLGKYGPLTQKYAVICLSYFDDPIRFVPLLNEALKSKFLWADGASEILFFKLLQLGESELDEYLNLLTSDFFPQYIEPIWAFEKDLELFQEL